MNNEIIRLATTQGLFAVLFVALFFYVLKENSRRECKYQEIIKDLASRFEILKDISMDIKYLKQKVYNRGCE